MFRTDLDAATSGTFRPYWFRTNLFQTTKQKWER